MGGRQLPLRRFARLDRKQSGRWLVAAYGPSKAALEALSAIMAKDLDGSGVTVNVLVPGGVTNTPMISDEAGFERDAVAVA
jgi:NAD(P)-dependent dehydrogenase (short-subunit alcohol dehydrogenase family)